MFRAGTEKIKNFPFHLKQFIKLFAELKFQQNQSF